MVPSGGRHGVPLATPLHPRRRRCTHGGTTAPLATPLHFLATPLHAPVAGPPHPLTTHYTSWRRHCTSPSSGDATASPGYAAAHAPQQLATPLQTPRNTWPHPATPGGLATPLHSAHTPAHHSHSLTG